AVNAVSEWLVVDVKRDGKLYRQRYERGVPMTDVEVIGPAEGHGTKTTFMRDTTIFTPTAEYKFHTLAELFRQLAFLTQGLTIHFRDERGDGQETTYYFQGGIKSFVHYMNLTKRTLTAPFYVRKTVDTIEVEVALQYTDGYNDTVLAFANN